MAIGLLIGFLLGFILGMAFTIWIVKTADYDWNRVLHRWYIELVRRRYRGELEEEPDSG